MKSHTIILYFVFHSLETLVQHTLDILSYEKEIEMKNAFWPF